MNLGQIAHRLGISYGYYPYLILLTTFGDERVAKNLDMVFYVVSRTYACYEFVPGYYLIPLDYGVACCRRRTRSSGIGPM